MNGSKIVLDTNIILYLLNGDETLAEILDNKQIYVSVITELELLGFAEISEKEEKVIEHFLSECKIISINNAVKKETIRIRKKYKTKLPDSIIIATALFLELPLITADFELKKVDDIPMIYYEV